jgi:transposase
MSVGEEDSVAGVAVDGRRRRRSWSDVEKRRIVVESLEPGVSVSVVARRHDVNANQVFAWRRQLRDGDLGATAGGLVPMMVATAPAGAASAVDEKETDEIAAGVPPSPGRIEIVLAGGCRVIVDRAVDGVALARVVAVLERK